MDAMPFIRTLRGFEPSAEIAQEAMSRVTIGKEVMLEWKQSRNIKAHKLWWGLCGIIHNATDRYESVERVSDMFKIATGHYDEIVAKPTKETASLIRTLRHRAANGDPKMSDLLTAAADALEGARVMVKPKSIAFASLKEDDFRPILDWAIRLTCTQIIPGLPECDLRDELEQIVGR